MHTTRTAAVVGIAGAMMDEAVDTTIVVAIVDEAAVGADAEEAVVDMTVHLAAGRHSPTSTRR